MGRYLDEWKQMMSELSGPMGRPLSKPKLNQTTTSGLVSKERVLTEEEFYGRPIDQTNPKDLIGVKKPNMYAVPPAAILHEAMAMNDGGEKYGFYNWREKAVKTSIYISACMRHLEQFLDGENYDPKSKCHHLGHARACLGILLDAIETGNLVDDRPKKGAAAEMIRHFEEKGTFDGR